MSTIHSRLPAGLLISLTAAASLLTAGAHAQESMETAHMRMLESLAERVQVLEDREEIRALILAYGSAHDGRDYRTFADLFAENGEWIGGLGSAKGPEAIFALMDETIGHDPQPGGSGTYHIMTNEQIEIDGDRASALTKWIYLTPAPNGSPQMVYLGDYRDEYIREDGVWKFLRREAPGLIAAPPPGR